MTQIEIVLTFSDWRTSAWFVSKIKIALKEKQQISLMEFRSWMLRSWGRARSQRSLRAAAPPSFSSPRCRPRPTRTPSWSRGGNSEESFNAGVKIAHHCWWFLWFSDNTTVVGIAKKCPITVDTVDSRYKVALCPWGKLLGLRVSLIYL